MLREGKNVEKPIFLQTSELPIPHVAGVFPMSCWHTQRIQNYPRMTVSIPCPKIDGMINPFLGTHLENLSDTYWDEFIAFKAVLELICDTVDGSEIRLTSGAWKFIPLFVGFEHHPRRCRFVMIHVSFAGWKSPSSPWNPQDSWSLQTDSNPKTSRTKDVFMVNPNII